MTTVKKKMKDAERAALQNELKYYSGLLAAHHRSTKIPTHHPNVQNNMIRNSTIPTCSTFKTTTNPGHPYKYTSFQQKTFTRLPNQNSKVTSSVTLHKEIDLPYKVQVPNSFNLRKYPCKSSMVKVNPPVLSYKSINPMEKTLLLKNSIKEDILDSKKQLNQGVMNKPSVSHSQGFMDELGALINQLKQRTKHIDKKMNHVSSKSQIINKHIPDKSELKVTTEVPTDSKIFCNALNKISQSIDLEDKKGKIFTSGDISVLPSSKNSTSCLFDVKKEISHGKSPVDMNNSSVKPLRDLRTNFLQQSNHQIVKNTGKPCKETSQNLSKKFENLAFLQVNNTIKTPVKKKLIIKRNSVKKLSSTTLFASKYKVVNRKLPCVESSQSLSKKFGNLDILQVNNTIKTPVKKKLIIKRNNSVKKLSGTTLFASKYKVVNRRLPCVESGKKVVIVSPGIKTPLKMKPVKKHINSVKKIKVSPRPITTKYLIINKKLPCVQSNSKNSSQETNGIKMKVNKLNSKYKIVNRNEKSVTVPMTLFVKKNINTKETVLSNFVQQGSENKFSVNNSLRKTIYTTSKLHDDKNIMKSMTLVKQKHSHILNLKRKKHSLSGNSFVSNSKYRTVNKQPGKTLKKPSETAKSSNLHSDQNSSIDLDLLMEIAAEKKECNGNPITNSPSKHVLVKRVYKSKNAIVNKNISSLQTKAAKMIKTKYSILNKKHTWQKQGFNKRLISPKSFKGPKFNGNYRRKLSFYHTRKNKRNISRHHVSAYFAGRNYTSTYFSSKIKSIPVGPFRSVIKTPKRFVLNRKVQLKTPNTMKLYSPASKTMASRALNRSINRVINASVKKKTSKVNVYCMFYNRFGRCNKGIKCPYVHDPSKIAVCTRFLRGTCKTENCPFSHEICPGKMAICSFFLLGSCTKTDCPYRHETLSPNAKLCKAFVEGYCPNGKQCKQAHVLFCPQFVQGYCEKGKACPFPHPPPKGKKAIPNSSEVKSENLKETEELTLEKMSRYFECGNEPETKGYSSLNIIAVPRIRNLPEQPSFIAL